MLAELSRRADALNDTRGTFHTPLFCWSGCAYGAGGASSPNAGADLDNADLVSWLNCECFFSLVLVGLLAALPFNLHTQELMQTPETYVARAMELSEEGAFDKVDC